MWSSVCLCVLLAASSVVHYCMSVFCSVVCIYGVPMQILHRYRSICVSFIIILYDYILLLIILRDVTAVDFVAIFYVLMSLISYTYSWSVIMFMFVCLWYLHYYYCLCYSFMWWKIYLRWWQIVWDIDVNMSTRLMSLCPNNNKVSLVSCLSFSIL